MKKKYKWLIWIGGFVLLAVLSIWASVFISERSRDSAFDPTPLIGLTKEEVLELAFDRYPKIGHGELNIIVQRTNKYGKLGPCENLYYKTIEEAKNDAKLMSSDIWETNERKKFSISILQKVEVYVFYFENGKVVNVERKNWYRE